MPRTRPPMGWNSWDCFGGSVTEDDVLENSRVIHDRLLPHGWDTVVVDIQWYEDSPGNHDYNDHARPTLDAWGRQLPSPIRFPSASDGAGFTALARTLHDLGLRFGVHVMRGVPRAAVEQRLPVLGTEWTCDEIADTSDTCRGTPTTTACATNTRAPRPGTTPRSRCSPSGASTSSSSTTCCSRSPGPTSRPTARPSPAAVATSS